jgi:fatty acid amide hydrolase
VEEWAPPDMPAAWVMYLGLLMADGMAGTRRRVGRGALDGIIKQMLLAGAFPRWFVSGISAPVFRVFGQRHMAKAVRGMGHISADGYWKLVEASRRYRQRFLGELSRFGFDAIICPPDALPAILHGSGQFLSDALSYGALYNLLGMPAGVVPATCVRRDEENDRPSSIDLVERAAVRSERGSAGLPVGVQVAARHWREDIVLSVMSALQVEFRGNREYPSYPPLSR